MFRPFIAGAAVLGLLAGCSSVPDCTEKAGFELGRDDIAPPPACQERGFHGAWQLGRNLAELESERAELLSREGDLEAADRMRLRVLERDIPELETLARILSLMEPTSVSE